MWNSKPQTTFHRVTAVHTTRSSFTYILALTHFSVCMGTLSVMLSATTLTDSKQIVLACGCLRASTPHITNGRYVIHLRKSGLMSLQSSQQPQKIMLLFKMTCKNMAKNSAWSQLSVAVSMVGMLHPPLLTSMWFLSAARCTCKQETQGQEAFQGCQWHLSFCTPTVTSMPFIFLSHFL